jgi:F0F1-type ATP synthase membrane subunit c/vacuolar-type H+-ATPase subunit K
MLVGFAEGLGAAKTYAAREHYEIDANRELLGLGGANIAAGLSSGMVVNGSLSKTAVNGSAGARTQLSGLIVAALTILTLLALTGLFEDLPEATLAAIVIAAVIELVDYRALIELYRAHTERLGREFGFVSRPDFIAAVAALLGVTAARMLATLAEDLAQRNVRLLLARDIGQVRDILRSVIDNPAIIAHYYPTVQAAVAAAQQRTEGVPLRQRRSTSLEPVIRRGGRAVECGALERRCASIGVPRVRISPPPPALHRSKYRFQKASPGWPSRPPGGVLGPFPGFSGPVWPATTQAKASCSVSSANRTA